MSAEPGFRMFVNFSILFSIFFFFREPPFGLGSVSRQRNIPPAVTGDDGIHFEHVNTGAVNASNDGQFSGVYRASPIGL